jgi:hypothetical protein
MKYERPFYSGSFHIENALSDAEYSKEISASCPGLRAPANYPGAMNNYQ